jgi:hypothetical protein
MPRDRYSLDHNLKIDYFILATQRISGTPDTDEGLRGASKSTTAPSKTSSVNGIDGRDLFLY